MNVNECQWCLIWFNLFNLLKGFSFNTQYSNLIQSIQYLEWLQRLRLISLEIGKPLHSTSSSDGASHTCNGSARCRLALSFHLLGRNAPSRCVRSHVPHCAMGRGSFGWGFPIPVGSADCVPWTSCGACCSGSGAPRSNGVMTSCKFKSHTWPLQFIILVRCPPTPVLKNRGLNVCSNCLIFSRFQSNSNANVKCQCQCQMRMSNVKWKPTVSSVCVACFIAEACMNL